LTAILDPRIRLQSLKCASSSFPSLSSSSPQSSGLGSAPTHFPRSPPPD
jgi:hypothetical protein